MAGPDDARATLLRALEQIEQAENELGDGGEVRHLVVVYSATKTLEDGGCHEVGGWCATTDPTWIQAALLRRAADSIECDDEDEDDDGD